MKTADVDKTGQTSLPTCSTGDLQIKLYNILHRDWNEHKSISTFSLLVFHLNNIFSHQLQALHRQDHNL